MAGYLFKANVLTVIIYLLKLTKMKNAFKIAALVLTVTAFASCGPKPTTETLKIDSVKTDSTTKIDTVKVDSTKKDTVKK